MSLAGGQTKWSAKRLDLMSTWFLEAKLKEIKDDAEKAEFATKAKAELEARYYTVGGAGDFLSPAPLMLKSILGWW